MPKVHFGKRGGAYILKYGKKKYLSSFGLPEGQVDPTPEAIQFLQEANNTGRQNVYSIIHTGLERPLLYYNRQVPQGIYPNGITLLEYLVLHANDIGAFAEYNTEELINLYGLTPREANNVVRLLDNWGEAQLAAHYAWAEARLQPRRRPGNNPRFGGKRSKTRFGGSNEDFFPAWFNDERETLLRRCPPGVRSDYALVSMPINESEERGPTEPSAYELDQQKYYAENQVRQYESSMRAIFNKALSTFQRRSARATPEQIVLGDIPNSTNEDYTRSPINLPAGFRFRGGPRSWASIEIGTPADQLRKFRNAYNYIRETARVNAAIDTGLQFGRRR